MDSHTHTVKEHHLLLLNYSEVRVVLLESRLMVLGLDPSQDIDVVSEKVSSDHATLLRVPSLEPQKFSYRLIDGGPNVNRCQTGIQINGKSAYMHLLEHGDMITLSAALTGLYLKVELKNADFTKYLELIGTTKEINQKNRDKIMLMTRVFDKLMPYFDDPEAFPMLMKQMS